MSVPKIQDRYLDDKNERDYIKKISLRDTRSWFRMRSRMTLRIKANSSSAFRDNMECRHCDTGAPSYAQDLPTNKGT